MNSLRCVLPIVQVRAAAVRVLAVLGQNDKVDKAVGKRAVRGRGLRVLALDGGGMKGMTEVTMLRELERRTGSSIRDLFDVCPMLCPSHAYFQSSHSPWLVTDPTSLGPREACTRHHGIRDLSSKQLQRRNSWQWIVVVYGSASCGVVF